MNITPEIHRALQKSAILHEGQKRKGPDAPPYIIHPVAVAAKLASYFDDEPTIIAGLLHDTIEDTPYSFEDLEQEFGTEVRAIVAGVTEPKLDASGAPLAWRSRKDVYLANLAQAPEKSLFVAAADKWHNGRSLLDLFASLGPRLWSEYVPNGPEQTLWYFKAVLEVFKGRTAHPLVDELEAVYTESELTFR